MVITKNNEEPKTRNGSFELGDKILSMDIVQIKDGGILMFEVTWIQSIENTSILPTLYSNVELRKHEPDRLIDFYERKIRPCNQ